MRTLSLHTEANQHLHSLLIVEDLSLPKPLVCGGFQKLLSASIMWFSSGGTKSVLHNDDTENINCLFDGSKRFFMIDKVRLNTYWIF